MISIITIIPDPSIPSTPQPTTTTTTTTTTVAAPADPNCVDKSGDCKKLKAERYCELQQVWMADNCCQTCKGINCFGSLTNGYASNVASNQCGSMTNQPIGLG